MTDNGIGADRLTDAVPMEWRAHPEYPGYGISEYGDVRTFSASKGRWRLLRGSLDADGYLRYKLIGADGEKRDMFAHQLVIEAFVGLAPSSNHEVAHRNGSRKHNHYSNLKWATSLENHADRFVHGTAAQGINNGRSILTEADVLNLRRERREGTLRGERVRDLARHFDVNIATIYSAARGDSWKHLSDTPLGQAAMKSAGVTVSRGAMA
jgi:hypothetical protein